MHHQVKCGGGQVEIGQTKADVMKWHNSSQMASGFLLLGSCCLMQAMCLLAFLSLHNLGLHPEIAHHITDNSRNDVTWLPLPWHGIGVHTLGTLDLHPGALWQNCITLCTVACWQDLRAINFWIEMVCKMMQFTMAASLWESLLYLGAQMQFKYS